MFLATALIPPTPAWAQMWALAVLIYATAKLVTWRLRSGAVPHWLVSVGYLLAWPGMHARRFFDRRQAIDRHPALREWVLATVKLLFGLVLVFMISRWIPDALPTLRAWVGMAGIVFVLHFGVFHLLSCAWRSLGYNAEPPMHWPVLATSLSDFWSRRWNTAFRDFTYQLLFRPLASRWGATPALWIGFLASGLVHDAVVSLPAGGGYGEPTLYFLIQPLGMLVERSQLGKRMGLGRGWRGWLFAALVLLLPAPLLFHQPFLGNIVNPFLDVLHGTV